MKKIYTLALLAQVSACGSASVSSSSSAVPSAAAFDYAFTQDALPSNMKFFFTDYPQSADKNNIPNDAATRKKIEQFQAANSRAPDAVELGNIVLPSGSYYLTGGYQELVSAPDVKGFLVTFVNRSDDVDSNIIVTLGKAEGILPKTTYIVSGEIEFYSNTPTGGFGIGGAPDAVHYGLSVSPLAWDRKTDGSGHWRTTTGGKVNTNPFSDKTYTDVGVVNNGMDMEESNADDFTLQSRSSSRSVQVITGADGLIHANFRSHSGFESYSAWAVKAVHLKVSKK